MSIDNNTQGFEEAMRFHSLSCGDAIIEDRKLHRFYVAGDKFGSKNGWYVFFGSTGSYGSWRTGEKFIWSAKGTRMADAVYEQIKMQIDKARSDNKVGLSKRHVVVAESSQQEWFSAPPANPRHPYLMTKGVKPHGLRQIKNRLLVPLVDFHSTLWNLQSIYANNKKFFPLGGRVGGLFTPIGMERMTGFSRLVICEGWATGASLHEMMGEMILCAMNAGNLTKVAQGVRQHFPETEIIIAADNDRFTPGNPGITKAMEAARIVDAAVMIPKFPEGTEGTDYNDAVKLGWRG